MAKPDNPLLNASTWKKSVEPDVERHSTVPTLTLCCHGELSRVGERALLRGLMVGQPAQVSRLVPELTSPRGGTARPLADPFLSRTPLQISGDPRKRLVLDYDKPGELRVDGERQSGPVEIDAEHLEEGVVLTLADRVVLLLHLTSGLAPTHLAGILGESEGIDAVRRQITRVAELEVPVLVRGETGSGKELVAQAIHELSPRGEHAHVVVNMAAIPATTAASALFGHARGAFTGAQQRHVGMFERAHQGTLFLDEIGETPDEVQPMLLRVLETGKVLPLGDERERAIDVRLVAATDAALEQHASEGTFREALLHRLAGYEIRVPPLRERRDDVARLFIHFLREELTSVGGHPVLSSDASNPKPSIPTKLVERLLLHPLPGNVRQLRNIARHVTVASRGTERIVVDASVETLLGPLHTSAPPPGRGPNSGLPASPRIPSDAPAGRVGPVRRPSQISELDLISALETHQWSPNRAAAALGIATSTLHDLMRKTPAIRKAKDIEDDELEEAHAACDGDTARMAVYLKVSERALRMTLRERGMLDR